MANPNGQRILQALQNIEEPATFTEIVAHVADSAGVRPSEVKESVEEALKGGVCFGYIQCRNRKYSAVPVELHAIQSDEGDEEDEETDELADRSRRRRRGRGASRSRSRRRSRR